MAGDSFTRNHVDYVFAAEFDVDQGPVVRFQYPSPLMEGDENNVLAELMLPDQIHSRGQDWTVFFHHKTFDEGTVLDPSSRLYILNLVNRKIDDDARRGAVVRSMAVCSRHPFIHVFKPILVLALEEYFETSSIDTLKKLYDAINKLDISEIPELSLYELRILRENSTKNILNEKFPGIRDRRPSKGSISSTKTAIDFDNHFYDTTMTWNNKKIQVHIPVTSSSEIVGDASPVPLLKCICDGPNKPFTTLHPHLTIMGQSTPALLVLVNALLTEKRIIFLGHGKPAHEVVDVVLSACDLISGGGVLRGFMNRAFPYTDLSKVDSLLAVPGYIAGVTNPTFEAHPSWWDVLVNIENGEVTISRDITFPQTKRAVLDHSVNVNIEDSTDLAFLEDIRFLLTKRGTEDLIRLKFHDYIIKFIQMASDYEELHLDIGARNLPSDEQGYVIQGHGCVWESDAQRDTDIYLHADVIEAWRQTSSYSNYVADSIEESDIMPIKNMDINYHIDRLRKLHLTHDESAMVYYTLFDNIIGYDMITQLLSVMPQSQGGLAPIFIGLFHPIGHTRNVVLEILERIRQHPIGIHFFNESSEFYKLAFARAWTQKKEVDPTDGDMSEYNEPLGYDIAPDEIVSRS
ncbi:stabilization of polarity axis-domain-containing protein [Dipodascopsis uninucleata]